MQAIALAWIASVSTPTTPYSQLVLPFIMAGVGMALFFAPIANIVLSAVRPEQEGQASGANNAIRELGGVFGVAVLASVFAHVGGYDSGQSFVDGTTSAVYVGAAVVALGATRGFRDPRSSAACDRSRRRGRSGVRGRGLVRAVEEGRSGRPSYGQDRTRDPAGEGVAASCSQPLVRRVLIHAVRGSERRPRRLPPRSPRSSIAPISLAHAADLVRPGQQRTDRRGRGSASRASSLNGP